MSEFPIIDGIPIIMPQLRTYVADNIFHLIARSDLSPLSQSILSDCCSQGSVLDSMKQHLSSYVWDHYSEFDPNETPGPVQSGSVVRVLKHAFQNSNSATNAESSDNVPSTPAPTNYLPRDYPAIDIGCGPGRTTLELARDSESQGRTGLTLGIDMNFSMLRLASGMLRTGKITYPRRRIGVVYDQRSFDVPISNLEQVDFWACNALALPFTNGLFGRAVAMNVLDSVSSPYELLNSIANMLAPHGSATIACPYDWTASVTPVEGWLGGHSQRGETDGNCEPQLRRLMRNANQLPADIAIPLCIDQEWPNVPWTVRIHDRSVMNYFVHLFTAHREAD